MKESIETMRQAGKKDDIVQSKDYNVLEGGHHAVLAVMLLQRHKSVSLLSFLSVVCMHQAVTTR